jgi:hypothetical protein
MKVNPPPDREVLRSFLHYDPETGAFVWIAPRGRCRIGDVAGYLSPTDGYLWIRVNGRRYVAHRLAWFYMTGEWPEEQIDHRDADGANNRWGNLRKSTPRQNCANRRKRSQNRFSSKGVYYLRGSFHARIYIDGKDRYLGRYSSEAEAATAYLLAAKKNFGEFARGG